MILWLSGCYKPNLYTVTDGKKKSDWGRGSTELHFCENIIELSINNALTSYDKTTFIFILRDSLPNKLDERGTCILPLFDTDGLIVGINLPGVSGFPKISISGSAFRFLLGNLYADVWRSCNFSSSQCSLQPQNLAKERCRQKIHIELDVVATSDTNTPPFSICLVCFETTDSAPIHFYFLTPDSKFVSLLKCTRPASILSRFQKNKRIATLILIWQFSNVQF